MLSNYLLISFQVQLGGYRELRLTSVRKQRSVLERSDLANYVGGEETEPNVRKRLNHQNGVHPQTILKLQLGNSSQLSRVLHKEKGRLSQNIIEMGPSQHPERELYSLATLWSMSGH